jgi:hypothetical protein
MYGLFLVALILSNRAPAELVRPTQVGTFETKKACIQAAKESEYATGTGESNFALAAQFICVRQK